MVMRTRAETAEESVYQMRAEVSREREQKSVLQRELDAARAETTRVMNQLSAFDLQAATFTEEKLRLADQVRVWIRCAKRSVSLCRLTERCLWSELDCE
jgi:hypothetical protein